MQPPSCRVILEREGDCRTDNPFFPPLKGRTDGVEWESVRSNVLAAKDAFIDDEFDGVMGLNAIQILDLH